MKRLGFSLAFLGAILGVLFTFGNSTAKARPGLLSNELQHQAIHPPEQFSHPVYTRVPWVAAKPTIPQPATYTVQQGDTLWSIAKARYGNGNLWPALWYINRRKVPNPDSIGPPLVLLLSSWHPNSQALLAEALHAIPQPVTTVAVVTPSAPTQPSAPPIPSQPVGSLQQYAASLWGSQYSCGASVVNVESGWNIHATNPKSGAYGIPQALPGDKMASAGSDWHDNGYTQLRWMTGYMQADYGGPCGAWAHEQADGWY